MPTSTTEFIGKLLQLRALFEQRRRKYHLPGEHDQQKHAGDVKWESGESAVGRNVWFKTPTGYEYRVHVDMTNGKPIGSYKVMLVNHRGYHVKTISEHNTEAAAMQAAEEHFKTKFTRRHSPRKFHLPGEHDQERHGDWADNNGSDNAVARGILAAASAVPERLTHGHTIKNAFFLVGDKVYSFDKFSSIPENARREAVRVHSHSPDGAPTPDYFKTNNESPFNADDIAGWFKMYRTGNTGRHEALIYADGTMDIASITDKTNKAALGLATKRLEKFIGTTYAEAEKAWNERGLTRAQLSREKLRKFFDANGFDYREGLRWASPKEAAELRGRHPNERVRRTAGHYAHLPEQLVYASSARVNGYRLALMGFDFLPGQLPAARQRFKAYLQRQGVAITDAELEQLQHSWDVAVHEHGKRFLSTQRWRGALDLTPGSAGLRLFDKYCEVRGYQRKDHEAYQPHDDDPGVMVAVMLPSEVAERLAVPDGNRPDQLHCTLAYLGRLSKVQDRLPAIKQALATVAASHGRMTGAINGLGRFGASESSDGKEVVYATLDCPGLAALRQDLVDALEAAGVEVAKDHDFAPHITLSYVAPGEQLDVPMPQYELGVRSIALAWGDQQEEFQLAGPKDYAQRQLTPAERRVDFAQIKRLYDEDAPALVATLRGQLKGLRDEALNLFERQAAAGLSADFAASLRLSAGRAFATAVEDYLVGVWRRNRDLALAELPEAVRAGLKGLQKYASAFRPDVAGSYFRNRALLIKGLVEDELTRQVKLQIFEHLKGGRTLAETMGYLRDLFEPWIGTPVIEPSGISQTPEDILKPHRLELIVRMETNDAVNQGRRAVADAAEDFVLGYEHSSVLDDRTTELCQLADGIRYKKDDPRAIKLQPPLHWNCRAINTFITTNDEPVEWSSEEQLDEIVRGIPREFK